VNEPASGIIAVVTLVSRAAEPEPCHYPGEGPTQRYGWPLVFLDDVSLAAAHALADQHAALLVRTSREGGLHVWLATEQPLAESQRATVQRRLALTSDADLRSTSGEHLGRLAGFKNWKRGGVWVNVVRVSDRPPLPLSVVDRDEPGGCSPRSAPSSASGRGDTSPSGRDWAWVCASLERGDAPERVRQLLVERARQRRGRDVHRYARVTVARALDRVRRRPR